MNRNTSAVEGFSHHRHYFYIILIGCTRLCMHVCVCALLFHFYCVQIHCYYHLSSVTSFLYIRFIIVNFHLRICTCVFCLCVTGGKKTKCFNNNYYNNKHLFYKDRNAFRYFFFIVVLFFPSFNSMFILIFCHVDAVFHLHAYIRSG